MATNYPTSKQTFTNPSAGDPTNSPSHAGLHADLADTVEAIQDVIGTGSGLTLSGTYVADGDAAAATGIHWPGTAGNFATTPDTAALDITGDIDLFARVALDDVDGGQALFIGKNNDGDDNISYRFGMGNSGVMAFMWSTDGTTANRSITQSTALPVSDGQIVWVRVTLDVDNGSSQHVVRFYYSTEDVESVDEVTWTQHDSDFTYSGTTSIHAGTALGTVGAVNNGGSSAPMAGTVYEAGIRDGIGGSIVAHPKFYTPWYPRFTDDAGLVWTINGSAWSWTGKG